MAEIAEGFSVNATIILDTYSINYVVGDIQHPKVNLLQDETQIDAALTLNATDVSNVLGDFRRSNTGSQGFTLKSATILDDSDASYNIADISHGKCVIRDDADTTSALLKLDDSDLSLYLGDFNRSNTGSQGFTLKSVLELDNNDDTAYFGDVSHGKCITSTDEESVSSSLILGETNLVEIIGDCFRQNKGQQGFTISSKIILGSSESNDIVGDIFRKNEPQYNATAKILAYKGKYYLIYTNERLYYFVKKSGEE